MRGKEIRKVGNNLKRLWLFQREDGTMAWYKSGNIYIHTHTHTQLRAMIQLGSLGGVLLQNVPIRQRS